MTYTLVVQGFAQIADVIKVSQRLPPVANMLLSNAPGPDATLYLNGARLAELYPISLMPPGLSFNVTVLSYAGSLFIGVIAGRSATPELTRMTDRMGEAFEALEAAVVGKTS